MRNSKFALAGALLFAASLFAAPAIAQTSPGLTKGQVLTAGQWNALFAGKQDTLGYTPLNTAGGIMTGRLITAVPGATTAGFNLQPGTTPAAPVNGDMWMTSTALLARINGATVTLTAAGAGSFAATSPLTVSFPAGVVTYACATCGVTGSPLSQFAATTSAQLAGIISDETGSGALVFGTSPTVSGLTVTGSFTATGLVGNASLANSSLTVNGTSIALGASGTVTAAAGTLTGTTLNATVVSSSLTSVGTLTGGATGAGFTVALSTSTFTGTLVSARGGTGVPNSFNITVGGALTTAAAFSQAGAFATTITATATTNSTLPAGTHTLAALDVNQSWISLQSYADTAFALNGSISGNLTMRAAATAGSSVLRWPAGSTDFTATGGTGQFLKQTSAGGALTVAAILGADLPNPAAASLGGINSKDCTAGGQFVQVITTAGAVTCATPAGGGNVSNSGTPVANQLAQWTSATQIQGLTYVSSTAWTPTDASGAALSFTAVDAAYSQIGNMVFAYATLTYPSTANGSNALIGGLPVTVANHEYARQCAITFMTKSGGGTLVPALNTTQISPRDITGANILNSALSLQTVRFNCIYPAT